MAGEIFKMTENLVKSQQIEQDLKRAVDGFKIGLEAVKTLANARF